MRRIRDDRNYYAPHGMVIAEKKMTDSKYYTQRKKEHRCISCGQELPPSETRVRCDGCRASDAKWRRAHRAEIRAVDAKYRASHKAKIRAYRKAHREQLNQYAKAYNRKRLRSLKRRVIGHYGDRCECCAERRLAFLSIDHINGGGGKHRREIAKSGTGFYAWLVKHNFPQGFRVLCHNCNHGRHINGGTCPHQDASAEVL